eukprot:2679601-Lingulodinium_polyedra.AAC.1
MGQAGLPCLGCQLRPPNVPRTRGRPRPSGLPGLLSLQATPSLPRSPALAQRPRHVTGVPPQQFQHLVAQTLQHQR